MDNDSGSDNGDEVRKNNYSDDESISTKVIIVFLFYFNIQKYITLYIYL